MFENILNFFACQNELEHCLQYRVGNVYHSLLAFLVCSRMFSQFFYISIFLDASIVILN